MNGLTILDLTTRTANITQPFASPSRLVAIVPATDVLALSCAALLAALLASRLTSPLSVAPLSMRADFAIRGNLACALQP